MYYCFMTHFSLTLCSDYILNPRYTLCMNNKSHTHNHYMRRGKNILCQVYGQQIVYNDLSSTSLTVRSIKVRENRMYLLSCSEYIYVVYVLIFILANYLVKFTYCSCQHVDIQQAPSSKHSLYPLSRKLHIYTYTS